MTSYGKVKSIHSSRGAVFIGVMFICCALLVVFASFYGLTVVNRRMNHKTLLLAEARNGAEGALQFALAELNRRATAYSAMPESPLSGYTLSSANKDYLAGLGTQNNLVSSSLTLNSGKLKAAMDNLTFLGLDPFYMNDTDKAKPLGVRSGDFFAKASAKDPVTGALTTAYVAATVQTREQNWLNYAIFYNMDLEFHPGVDMNIKGAVHTNANLYLAADGSGTQVNLYAMTTAFGRIYRGIKYDLSDHTWFEGQVFCINAPGMLSANLQEMTYAQDSRASNWLSLETAVTPPGWNGFVLDQSKSVARFNPPGLPAYVAENFSTTTTTELRNPGYSMIEPQLPITDTTRYYGRKAVDSTTTSVDDVENIKYSALAGLTIVVEAPDASRAGYGNAIPWKLRWYKATDASRPVNKSNLPQRDANGLPVVLGEIDPFSKNNDEIENPTSPSVQRNLKTLLRDAIVVVPYDDSGKGTLPSYGTGTTTVTLGTYPATAAKTSIDPLDPLYTASRFIEPAGSYPTPFAYPVTNVLYKINDTRLDTPYPGASGLPNTVLGRYSGFYDRRQGFIGTSSGDATTNCNNGLLGAMHAVIIDLNKLNWILNHLNIFGTVPPPSANAGTKIYDPAVSYSGVIYVDLPSDPKDTDRFSTSTHPNPDKICHAVRTTTTTPGYCVVLKNCKTLPRITNATGTDNLDSSGYQLRDDGFTIATNGPLYTIGSYNADGDSSTGSNQMADVGSTTTNWYPTNKAAELPAMLAADAVTFLTDGYDIRTSNRNKPTGNTTGSISSNFLEISSAVITGITATIPKVTGEPYLRWSGGVMNLPRFLEDDGSITVRYRGSMVAIFEDEVSMGYFVQGKHGYWYTPPTRDWGYAAYFAGGKFPPATPGLRHTRLMNLRDITKAEYDTGPIQP